MKKAIQIILPLLCLIVYGCKEEESADTPIPFIIYGTVFDYGTGEPVRGAEVSLYTGLFGSSVGSSQPEGAIGAAVTGYDGQYEMHCSVTENIMRAVNYRFTIHITAYGHYDFKKELTLRVSEDSKIQVDATIH